MTAARSTYPRKAVIERAIAAARAGGIKVGGIEVDPDGTIRILGETDAPTASSFERWQAKRNKAA